MKSSVEDLKKIIAGVLPPDKAAALDPAKPLAAQGLDSLAMTAIAVALQKAYKVTLSVEESLKIKTLNDVVALLGKQPG